MKSSPVVRLLFAPLVSALSLAVQPVFVVPFIAGAAWSYLCPEQLPTPLQAFAETEAKEDPKHADILVDIGSPRPEKFEFDKEGKRKKKDLPTSGVLSQTRSSGTSGTSVPSPWGSDALDKSAPPITGSVSRLGNNQWVVKVFNNSEDTYSATVEVVQMGRGSQRLKSDNYSYTLKGKGKAEREFKANQGATDCVLNLTRWKNLTAKKKAASPVETPSASAGKAAEKPAVAVPAESSGEPAE